MQQPGKFKLGRFDPETHRQGEAGAAGRSEEQRGAVLAVETGRLTLMLQPSLQFCNEWVTRLTSLCTTQTQPAWSYSKLQQDKPHLVLFAC